MISALQNSGKRLAVVSLLLAVFILSQSVALAQAAVLTDAEKQLAAQTSFDPNALEIVKDKLLAKMSLGPTAISLTDKDMAQTQLGLKPQMIPQDRAKLEKIAVDFPQFKPMVDARLLDLNANPGQRMENINALKELMSKSKMPASSNIFARQNGPAKPVTTIALDFIGSKDNAADLIAANGLLNDLNYIVTMVSKSSEARMFATRAEATSFLEAHGTPIDNSTLIEKKPVSFDGVWPIEWERDFNTDKQKQSLLVQMGDTKAKISDVDDLIRANKTKTAPLLGDILSSLYFKIPDGATVVKVADRKWRVTAPLRYEALASNYTARLVKFGDVPFEQVLANYGINYLKDNKPANGILLEALKKWDESYGVTFVDASFLGPILRFKKLPDNLDNLLAEIKALTPTGPAAVNAAEAHEDALAEELRSKHQVLIRMPAMIAIMD